MHQTGESNTQNTEKHPSTRLTGMQEMILLATERANDQYQCGSCSFLRIRRFCWPLLPFFSVCLFFCAATASGATTPSPAARFEGAAVATAGDLCASVKEECGTPADNCLTFLAATAVANLSLSSSKRERESTQGRIRGEVSTPEPSSRFPISGSPDVVRTGTLTMMPNSYTGIKI